MEKLLAMHVAAMLTNAACGSEGGTLPVSPDLSDNNVRAKNLQAWETFRVFYRGVVGALPDDQNWPTPSIPTGTLLPSLLTSLAPLVTGGGPLAGIVDQVLKALPAPKTNPPLPANLPDPGAKK